MERAFVAPIRATMHLAKLAELAASMPSAVRCFTLEHVSLETHLCWSRKNFNKIPESPLQYQAKGSM